MRILLKRAYLYLRLLWNHVVFWAFPTPPENYYSNIATIYFEDCKYTKAICSFLASENSYDHRDITLTKYNSYYLGYSYLNLGALRRAIEHFEKYFQLSRNDFEIASTIGWYYGLMSDHQTALKWYLCALALEPNLWQCRIECSRLLGELGRREEALRQLEESKAASQSLVEARIIDSLKQKLCGDLQGAIQTLQEAISRAEPLDHSLDLAQKEDAYILLANLQREFGDLNGALASLQAALERDSSDPWIFNEISMEYADQGIRLEEALVLIDRALKLQQENPIFLDTKGWVLLKLGRREDARATFERCMELLPDYKVAEEHYQLITA